LTVILPLLADGYNPVSEFERTMRVNVPVPIRFMLKKIDDLRGNAAWQGC
jgi:hypothetical protein